MDGLQEEPGELDNVLSLNVNDAEFKDTVADWKNGEKYSVQDGTTIRQISPGKYELLTLVAKPAPDTEGEPNAGTSQSEDGEPARTETRGSYPNPAVAGLMAGEKQ